MRHHRKHGRAHGASARSTFEQFEEALRGNQGHRPGPRHDHKTMQLCRQVLRAISLELADEPVTVEAVEPLGSASQLLVRVGVPPTASPAEVVARLNGRSPHLRSAVAAAISRKRVPTLAFVAVLSGGEERHD